MANFGQTRPKMTNFRIFLKKQKRHFFALPKTSIHAKNQKIPMRSFGENLADGNERERDGDDRDEGEFIGPNPPGGRRTKDLLCETIT